MSDLTIFGGHETEIATSFQPLVTGTILRLDEYGDKSLPPVILLPAEGEFTIGRFDASVGMKQNDFEFGKHTVNISRRHAFCTISAEGVTVTDLDSKAGTWVNGERIASGTAVPVLSGHKISFGNAGADYVMGPMAEAPAGLAKLVDYKGIVIQCHNIPDADTVASAFALQCFFRSLGAESTIVYGGPAPISKPSLLMMLEMLKVEITHTKSLPPNTDLLITVDCQHGAGNVQAFPLSDSVRVMTIDHHKPETPEMMTNGENVIIRSELASCSTLVWDLLRKERYEMEAPVVNALYYGLYTDTNGLSELRHPLDRDLAEQPYDVGFIRVLKNASISMEELDIMARSLQKREMIGEIGLFCADRCDANLLGFASDIAQQVVGVNACVVYCVQEHGVKLSVRACTREIMASELADFICREAGSGGGAAEKAGGYMSLAALAEKATPPGEYVRERIREYARHYELIYAADNAIDFAGMKPYKKQATPVAYMSIADVFPVGTKITVRTQSGDSDGIVDRNTVLMISADSSLYPITRQRFEAGYDVLGNAFYPAAGYTPVIVNRHTQERHSVFAYARTCIPKDEKPIRAIQLTRAVKLFSRWDTDRYTTGEQGDWLTATDGDYDNCVLVKAEEFAEMYIPC